MSDSELTNSQSTGRVSYRERIVNSSNFVAELKPDGQSGSRLAPGGSIEMDIRKTLEITVHGTRQITVRHGAYFEQRRPSLGANSVTVLLNRTGQRPKLGDIEITNPPG